MNDFTITVGGTSEADNTVLASLISRVLIAMSFNVDQKDIASLDQDILALNARASNLKIRVKTKTPQKVSPQPSKTHINETTTLQLNWLVAKCKNLKPQVIDGQVMIPCGKNALCDWNPAGNDRHAGPIIDESFIGTERGGDGWQAVFNGIFDSFSNRYNGPTRLVAAMRCYVANNLGDMVELPAELR